MANVQPENGFTKIANELMEVIMKQKFNGTQFKIILAVWRYTYGFQRKEHEMSLTFLSNSTGVHKQTVRNELERLIERKVILVTGDPSYTTSRKLSFNKNYDVWVNLQSVKRHTPSKSTDSTVSEITNSTVSELTDSTVSELTDSTVSESTDQERNIKETLKENIKEKIPYKEIVDYLNIKTNSKYKYSTPKTQEFIRARWNEGFCLNDFKQVIDKKVAEWTGTQYEQYLRPNTLFSPKFEGYLNQKVVRGNASTSRSDEAKRLIEKYNLDF